VLDSGVELSIAIKRLSTSGRKISRIPLCEMGKVMIVNGGMSPSIAIIDHFPPYFLEMSRAIQNLLPHFET
jgi:hypothetical protein